MDDLMASMAVRIPTKAIIPKEIINAVKVVRNNWLLIARKEIRIFSFKKEAICCLCSTKIAN
jgi:hypothetical protein